MTHRLCGSLPALEASGLQEERGAPGFEVALRVEGGAEGRDVARGASSNIPTERPTARAPKDLNR